MFLLAIQTTLNLINSYNSGTSYATADVLDSLWNYVAGTLCPIAAGAGRHRRDLELRVTETGDADDRRHLGLLTVSSVWTLITKMM